MSWITETIARSIRTTVAIVDLKGMWVGLALLNVFYFIVRIYEQIFGVSAGLDSVGPEYRYYWERILWIEIPLELVSGLALAGYLWNSRTRDFSNLMPREEMRRLVVEVQWLVLYGFAIYWGASFFTEQDVVWRMSASSASFFTPTHIIEFYMSYPIYSVIAVGGFFYAKTRLPYFAMGYSLAFLIVIIGPFMMIPGASAYDWGRRFWCMEETSVAPMQWGFVFFGWMTLGMFGVVLQLLMNVQRLLGKDVDVLLVWLELLRQQGGETGGADEVEERAVRECNEPTSEEKQPSERRWLEASLEGGPLTRGENLTLFAQLVVNASSTAHVVSAEARIRPSLGHVTFTCQAEGFRLKSASKMTLDILPGMDTDKAPFSLEVLSAEQYRITVTAYQEGTLCGQVVVDDFTAVQPAPPSQPLSTTQDRKREPVQQPLFRPELTLEFAGPSAEITASSPKEIFDWNAQNLGIWPLGTDKALDKLRKRIVRLYDCKNKNELDKAFRVLGREIAKAMPEELIRALRDARIKDLFIQSTADFDFPFEFALLESSNKDDQWLLQDRVASSRWFVNAKALQINSAPDIHKIALAIGKMRKDPSVELDVFRPLRLSDDRIVRFGTADALTKSVFRTVDYGMLHYFGHLAREEDDESIDYYLTFADDGSIMSLRSIGVELSDRSFFKNGPVIVLNCCESAGELTLIVGRESLPYRLIELNALACVSTLWPVESRAANKFMSAFYRAVARGDYLHRAVKEARAELLAEAHDEKVTLEEAITWTLAARSYVYYGPPDLKCVFA